MITTPFTIWVDAGLWSSVREGGIEWRGPSKKALRDVLKDMVLYDHAFVPAPGEIPLTPEEVQEVIPGMTMTIGFD